jgi:hypothetical protein
LEKEEGLGLMIHPKFKVWAWERKEVWGSWLSLCLGSLLDERRRFRVNG